jgi:DNA-binding transcriptional LysR family regulator
MNLNQLRIFYYAAKEKNLTKAAESLYVTQPAVTMQIKALEQALEVTLFKKRGKFLELTDAGNVLFTYAHRIFGIVEEMEHVLKGYAASTHGSLIIGTTRSFARHLMPRLLSRFQEQFPNVKVSLEVGSSQEVADAVIAFRYDIGIMARLPVPAKLKVIPYTKEEFCLVMSPKHRLARKTRISCRDLEEEPIIIREPGSGSRHALLSFLNAHEVKPSVLVEAGSVEFIKEYVIQGKGISLLYKPEVQRESRRGLIQVADLEQGPISIQTDIVFPEKITLTPPAQAFLQMVKSRNWGIQGLRD